MYFGSYEVRRKEVEHYCGRSILNVDSPSNNLTLSPYLSTDNLTDRVFTVYTEDYQKGGFDQCTKAEL